jgi:AcrR family transcriptional regulator
MDPSGPTTGAAQTRERIQEVAAKLFSDRGYRGVGVAELGDAVGLGRGALYYHIGSKEELLFNIIVKYIEALVLNGRDYRHSEPDPRVRVRKLSRYLMRVIAQNMPEMTLCFRESDALTGQRHVIVANLHQQYQDIWGQTFKDGEDKGFFRPISPVALKGILGMYFHSFLWFNPNGEKTYEDVADIFSDMVLAILDKRNTSQI